MKPISITQMLMDHKYLDFIFDLNRMSHPQEAHGLGILKRWVEAGLFTEDEADMYGDRKLLLNNMWAKIEEREQEKALKNNDDAA